MRLSTIAGAALLTFGLTLLLLLVRDATAFVEMLGLEGPGSEGIVAIVGLTVAALAVFFGVRLTKAGAREDAGVTSS
jgi:hypothetical protein